MVNLNWDLAKIARITHGNLHGDPSISVKSVTIDSRQDVASALFIAIRGERFDGHDFVTDVASRGASAVLVEKKISGISTAQIVVPNTVDALQALGRERRLEFKGTVVAITGSSGKTTTRRLVQSILCEKYCTHQPRKNFNNHIGVPLTLLELDTTHGACVLELGCSDFGEIETLTKISNPDIALVTNVGPAHLEKLKDLDGVARAKGELFKSMGKDTTALLNVDDARVAKMPINSKTKLSYGKQENADIRLISNTTLGLDGQKLVFDLKGEKIECVLPLVGSHNAVNATAAIAVGATLRIDREAMAKGLGKVTAEPGRLCLTSGPRKSIIIDDTYNANPASMKAAIRSLMEVGKKRRTIAVLGDMLELGDTSLQHHQNIGGFVAEQGVSLLVTLGLEGISVDEGAAQKGLSADRRFHADDHKSAAEFVHNQMREGDVVLVKGSRGMRMEQIVKFLKDPEA